MDLNAPFGRLALAHVLSLGGDALVALVLAGSLFFSIDPSGARWRIALYLAFTMAPFAVVGPLIGPVMDRIRGGRQLMLTLTTAARAVVAVTMISSVASDSLLLFPEAFLMLVLSKSYAVAKASVVPATVSNDSELVEANSKLQILGGLAAFVFGAPGGLMLLLGGPAAAAALSVVVFVAATIASLRVPRTVVAEDPGASVSDEPEAAGRGVLAAASAMAALRWLVGFVTFLLAFALRGSDTRPGTGMTLGHMVHDPQALDLSSVAPPGAPPAWYFGVVVACSAVGGLIGAWVAPQVRRAVREEHLLTASLVVAALSGLGGWAMGGLVGMSLLALGAAVSAAAGKQAFDAVVQRDADESERGRLFGRFESRFQIIWVLGAAAPVVVAVPVALGAVLVFLVGVVAAAYYAYAVRVLSRGGEPPELPGISELVGVLRSRDRGSRESRSPRVRRDPSQR